MLNTKQIENAVTWACIQEVSAPKPGNVNCFSDGHNMSIKNFIDSAHAIAPVLARQNLTIGEMILSAVKATRLLSIVIPTWVSFYYSPLYAKPSCAATLLMDCLQHYMTRLMS